jgi:flagellar hook-length control protein FliK
MKGGETMNMMNTQNISYAPAAENLASPSMAGGEAGQFAAAFGSARDLATAYSQLSGGKQTPTEQSDLDPAALSAITGWSPLTSRLALVALSAAEENQPAALQQATSSQVTASQVTAPQATESLAAAMDIVSVLEGNKDTSPLSARLTAAAFGELYAPGAAGSSATGQVTADNMARMPQFIADNLAAMPKEESAAILIRTGAALANASPADSPGEVGGDRSCPLGNGNDNEMLSMQVDAADSAEPQLKQDTGEAKSSANDAMAKLNQPAESTSFTDLTAALKPAAEGAARTAANPGPQQPQAVATLDNLFDTMVESVETLKNGDASGLTIKLKPDSLGQVKLELTLADGGLHVKIISDDPSVKGVINSQLTTLIDTLSDKGSRVVEIEVALSADLNGNQAEAREQQSNGYRSARQEQDYPALGTEEFEIYSALTAAGGMWTVDATPSQVEYHA